MNSLEYATREEETHMCLMNLPIEIISKKWSLNIIMELMKTNNSHTELDSLNYSELRDFIPEISPKMLAMRLNELVDCGIVERLENPVSPKKVRYQLSPKGLGFLPVLRQLRIWGLKFGEVIPQECDLNKCRHAVEFSALRKVSDY